MKLISVFTPEYQSNQLACFKKSIYDICALTDIFGNTTWIISQRNGYSKVSFQPFWSLSFILKCPFCSFLDLFRQEMVLIYLINQFIFRKITSKTKRLIRWWNISEINLRYLIRDNDETKRRFTVPKIPIFILNRIKVKGS